MLQFSNDCKAYCHQLLKSKSLSMPKVACVHQPKLRAVLQSSDMRDVAVCGLMVV